MSGRQRHSAARMLVALALFEVLAQRRCVMCLQHLRCYVLALLMPREVLVALTSLKVLVALMLLQMLATQVLFEVLLEVLVQRHASRC